MHNSVSLPVTELVEFAESSKISVEQLTSLAFHEDISVAVAAITNLKLPVRVLEVVLEEGDYTLCAKIAETRVDLPPRWFEHFIRETEVPEGRNWSLSAFVLCNPIANDPQALHTTANVAPLFTARAHATSPETLHLLADVCDSAVIDAVAVHENTTDDTLIKMLNKWGEQSYRGLAERQSRLSARVADVLIGQIHNLPDHLQTGTLGAATLTRENMCSLYSETNLHGKMGLLRRSDCPEELWRKAAEEYTQPGTSDLPADTTWLGATVAANENVPADIIRLLFNNHEMIVTSLALAHVNCPADVLTNVIFEDTYPLNLKEYAAGHPNCPTRARVLLAVLSGHS